MQRTAESRTIPTLAGIRSVSGSIASRVRVDVRRAWVWYAIVSAAAITAYYMLPRGGIGQAVVLTGVNAAALVATIRAAVRAHGSARVV